MKIKFLVLTSLFCLFSLPALAMDPECENPTQPDSLDFSDGVGHLCTPTKDVTGQNLADTKVLTCNVTFVDGTGATISTQEFVSGPGEFLTLTVPRDGVGTASADCTMDDLTSEAVTVTAVFPADNAPAQPVILR